MKFDLNDFRTDKDAKTNGVWIPFGGGAEMKIASFDSPAFTEAFRKATKPYQDLGRSVPEDDQVQIMTDCMAAHIVLDWKGVYEGDNEVPHSFENVRRVLKELEWVRDRVIAEARKLENFKAKQREDTEGN
ncbi:putative pre-tape measure chaperone protein [Pseudanabaena phage Pan1]|nr:putative pre-tape measure chaperone protein [Pseudanabaena phage Pan1]